MPRPPSRVNRRIPRPQAPTPFEVKQARNNAGLSQIAAAELIYCGCSAWEKYERGDAQIHPAAWEIFKLKTGMASFADGNVVDVAQEQD